MNDNVISLKKRRPLFEVEAEQKVEADKLAETNRAAHLQTVDVLRNLVEKDMVEGLVILGRNKETGFFFLDVIFPQQPDGVQACDAQVAAQYATQLDLVRNDFLDLASWAPVIMPDGSQEFPEYIGDEE